MEKKGAKIGSGYAALQDAAGNIEKLDGYAKSFLQTNEITGGFKQLLERLKEEYIKDLTTITHDKFNKEFSDRILQFTAEVEKVRRRIKTYKPSKAPIQQLAAEEVKKRILELLEDIRYSRINALIHSVGDPIERAKKQKLLTKKFDIKFEELTEKLKTIAQKETAALEEVPKIGTNPSEFVTKNKRNIFLILLLAVSGPILAKALTLAGIAFGGLSIAVAAASKKAKRLEELEKRYPGIFTLQQRRALKEFREISADPKMQGLIKNMHLRVARSKAAEETVKQYPALVTALGGAKKATKALKSYAERKWKESTLQKALGESVGKMARKFKKQLGTTRSKLQRQENKLVSQVKKAQLDVTQLKTALSSTAQSYIQQADVIMEDLKNKLIEAIEAGKLELQKTAPLPVIEL